MTWYRTGLVTVTNGSQAVTGAGTDFVANTQIGEVFLGPDGRAYEIAAIVSATQLTIRPAYQGASAGGQGYAVQPTASFARDLALLTAQLLNSFAAVRDGIGQGLMNDGSAATPGMRFAADQDSGLFRYGSNAWALVAGALVKLAITPDSVGVGRANGGAMLNVEPETTTSQHMLRLVQRFSSGSGYRWATIAMGVETEHVVLQGGATAGDNTPGAFMVSTRSSDTVLRGRFVVSGDGHVFSPFDNAQTMGIASNRWSVVYAGTGSINTSDAREKQDIDTIPDAWLDAWGEVTWSRFRFRDAVAAKGDDARWHIGLVAQQVRDTFAAHDLDAGAIGLLCYDEWAETPAVAEQRDEDGRVVAVGQDARSAGDRWGLRYDECQAMEAAWQRRRIARLEAALAQRSV